MSPPILPRPQQSVPYLEPALLVQPVACRVCSVARSVNLVRCQGCLVFSDRWDLVCRLYRLLNLFRWRLHQSLRLLWLPFNLSCLPLNLFLPTSIKSDWPTFMESYHFRSIGRCRCWLSRILEEKDVAYNWECIFGLLREIFTTNEASLSRSLVKVIN